MTKPKHVHNQTGSELDYDRTRTTMLRKQYSADMYKRFRKLKGLVRDTIQKYDAFNLKSSGVALADPARNFTFTQDSAKVDAFMDWLDNAEDDEILEIQSYKGGRPAIRNEWQNTYVKRSYKKGIKHANRELSKAGLQVPEEKMQAIFNKPIHADKLGMLYTRNFKELQGITRAMDQQISRELANGMAQGWNPRKMASKINDRVDKIGITRARTLARTEVIRAHSQATVKRYQEYGVQKGRLIWGGGPCTSGVCPDEASEGVQKLSNIAKPPLHPNCTCTIAPVVTDKMAQGTGGVTRTRTVP